MAGTHNSNRPQLLEDLDAMIVSRALRPGKVRLGGRLWTIKRDFTAAQVLEFHKHVGNGRDGAIKAFGMLVGTKDAEAFVDIALEAPTELMTQPLRQLYRLAGLLKRVDDGPADADATDDVDAEDAGEGESSAS
jgi:hypothetical protein